MRRLGITGISFSKNLNKEAIQKLSSKLGQLKMQAVDENRVDQVFLELILK